MRYRQVDITKLNYILLSRSLNQILQFYYLTYLPELKQVSHIKPIFAQKYILNNN